MSNASKQTRVVGVVALLAAMVGALVGGRGIVPVHAAPVPGGLPTHFGIGLMADEGSNGLGSSAMPGWMPKSGIPWDYAYQYLSGGVNTSKGWETWNGSGQFALYYAQNAAADHYIPVFSYYEIRQSTGTCSSCNEPQTDLSNLNNASTMASYFQNFRLLMQRLGSGTYNNIAGFGGTAIVQVEPDLSGYAEQAVNSSAACYGYCTAVGNNPSYLTAAVASSGDPDVQGYPNTYQGFNWALLHLRDKYAPNVKLAFHVSNWATGTDIGTDTSGMTSATSLGQEAGSFAAQSGSSGVPSGTSSYDLLFNDVSDRDEAVSGVWWDSLNVTYPNFHRWEAYVAAVSQAANRSVIVWQIPEGNQYFDTDNNTAGHYQDNFAEYFFTHIPELAGSGIIGLLFGPGNGGTSHADWQNDGITNPASFCTSDGLSSGQVCNTHTSTVADDDGGYIRMQGQAYYANPYQLGGTSSTSTPTTPVSTNTPSATPAVTLDTMSATPASLAPGGNTTFSATVTSDTTITGAIVDFEVYDASNSKVEQTYQTVNLTANTPQTFTATWQVPGTQAAGAYALDVGVFAPGWSADYAWASSAATITISTASPPAVSVGTGWNLLDVPAAGSGLTTTSALTSSLNSALGAGSVSMVATYRNGRYALYVPGYSADVSLQPWEGILVKSGAAGSWTPAGTAVSGAIPVPIAAGWNLVAAPVPTSGLTASQVASEIDAIGGSVQEVSTLGPSGSVVWTPGSSTSLSIPATSGMWILSSSSPSGNWSPS